jgi:hypothetical protein
VAKLRERISVSKRPRQKFDLERFDLKKLDAEVKKKYQLELSSKFATLENLDRSLSVNSAWESIRDIIKASAKDNIGYHRPKFNKPWFMMSAQN